MIGAKEGQLVVVFRKLLVLACKLLVRHSPPPHTQTFLCLGQTPSFYRLRACDEDGPVLLILAFTYVKIREDVHTALEANNYSGSIIEVSDTVK